MDKYILPTTGDYTPAKNRITSIENAVYLRLMTPLGAYWADPALGSRLHELRREKDLARVALLAQQYAEQALQPLIDDGRATSLAVETRRERPGWLILLVTITDATGAQYSFSQPVRVI